MYWYKLGRRYASQVMTNVSRTATCYQTITHTHTHLTRDTGGTLGAKKPKKHSTSDLGGSYKFYLPFFYALIRSVMKKRVSFG